MRFLKPHRWSFETELERHTNVCTYSIESGLVKTDTAMSSIEIISEKMGMGINDFYAMNESHTLGVEAAGVGVALFALYAQKYCGQKISSIQLLIDGGV